MAQQSQAQHSGVGVLAAVTTPGIGDLGEDGKRITMRRRIHAVTLKRTLPAVRSPPINSIAAVVFTKPKLLSYKELRRLLLGWPGVGRCRPVSRLLVFEETAVRPREELLLEN